MKNISKIVEKLKWLASSVMEDSIEKGSEITLYNSAWFPQ